MVMANLCYVSGKGFAQEALQRKYVLYVLYVGDTFSDGKIRFKAKSDFCMLSSDVMGDKRWSSWDLGVIHTPMADKVNPKEKTKVDTFPCTWGLFSAHVDGAEALECGDVIFNSEMSGGVVFSGMEGCSLMLAEQDGNSYRTVYKGSVPMYLEYTASEHMFTSVVEQLGRYAECADDVALVRTLEQLTTQDPESSRLLVRILLHCYVGKKGPLISGKSVIYGL